jgi:hypothetical protein
LDFLLYFINSALLSTPIFDIVTLMAAEGSPKTTPKEVRTFNGPVSGKKVYEVFPDIEEWEGYSSGKKSIGLADGEPGLIVPQTYGDFLNLYVR